MNEHTSNFEDFLNNVTAKRPRTVIQHILKHGYVTSQELKDNYGYNHPPRAVRDVREHGIPIITYRVSGVDGRERAAYKFGNLEDIHNKLSKSAGRTVLSQTLKRSLIQKYGTKCFVYREDMDEAMLQVDHRIPYEIGGEQSEQDIDFFMLLSPSANRSKSWACEHCQNWEIKNQDFCKKCFWAYPEHYEHIAGKTGRVVTLLFSENEIDDYNKLIKQTGSEEKAHTAIKNIIHEHITHVNHKL